MKLYGHPLSGNTHRVQALLSILGVDHDYETVDLSSGAHKQPDFLKMNPLGQVPVLQDGDVVLRDSSAILIYLARKFDKDNVWLPADPVGAAQVQQWLSTAVNEIQAGPFVLRLVKLLGAPLDYEGALTKTKTVFDDLFEPHLSANNWLVGDAPTLADLACYAYIARVTEGDFDLGAYPSIQSWLSRVEKIDGFPPMVHAAELMGG